MLRRAQRAIAQRERAASLVRFFVVGWFSVFNGVSCVSAFARRASLGGKQREWSRQRPPEQVALYWENEDPGNTVSIVPTSAITGEGVPDLLRVVLSLTQRRLSQQLSYCATLQCTVLEVKVVEGLGATLDVILVNGSLRQGLATPRRRPSLGFAHETLSFFHGVPSSTTRGDECVCVCSKSKPTHVERGGAARSCTTASAPLYGGEIACTYAPRHDRAPSNWYPDCAIALAFHSGKLITAAIA